MVLEVEDYLLRGLKEAFKIGSREFQAERLRDLWFQWGCISERNDSVTN